MTMSLVGGRWRRAPCRSRPSIAALLHAPMLRADP